MRGPITNLQPLRVLLVDKHEISRAACRALLRTEGLEVVADVAATDQAIEAATALGPHVAIIDVSPGDERPLNLACHLRALPSAPTVLLTSSTNRTGFLTEIDGFPFIAKADICAERIWSLLER